MFDLKDGAKVGIVSGSASDKAIVDKIAGVLDSFGIVWEHNVLSAHRMPNKTARYVCEAKGRGLQVLVGVAGLAAALPGVMASHTVLPVIGVPGTVGIGNGRNAGYLAAAIVALGDPAVAEKLEAYRRGLGDIEG